ncbi:ABC transporter ATP-binding protein [Pseudonocardia sp. EV170527-09]|uniref:ABC transporter ATP-binding protein n=1 Tax=Pseudonocardia sp. EV170527-09 TaxID=2603411 RepID=UPI0011F25A93|nr:ABC transporter ATP-binding protein [Pseudonocardia sp. EV170527-09]KAA1019170.1 ABC transporter ATP-binding protein [Pseudonocardia sp. EV170527-09]
MTVLRAEGVTVRFDGRTVLDGIDLAVGRGQWLSLVGRNGCGKTTLLRVLAGLHRPDAGSVHLVDRPLAGTPRREVAKRVAVLPQALPPLGGVTVRALVAQGRYAVRGPLGMLGGGADAAVSDALAATGTQVWADTPVELLSGGERQRVRIALALAQDAPVLLLDEPTTYLDVRHQLEVLDLVRELQVQRGLTVVAVLHDLAQAARCADRIVALRDGRVHADGPPADVVDEGLLAEVFGVRGVVSTHEGRLTCSYLDSTPGRPVSA